MSKDNVERALGPSESIFWLGDRACRYNVVVYADVDGPLEAESIRSGLGALQGRYPRLRTCVDTSAELDLRFRLTDSEIPLRLASGDWEREVQAELEHRFEEGRPAVRCVLVDRGDARWTVLLVFNHALGDGMSAIYMVRDLLLAAQPSPQTPVSTALVPSTDFGTMEELLPSPGGGLKRFWKILRMMGRILRRGLPTQIPKDGRAPARERHTRFAQITLEGALSAALLERARVEQTTVQGALCAALALAIADELPKKRSLWVDCLSAVNVRRDLSAPVEDAMGMYAASVAVMFTARRSDDFWEISRRARQDLAASLDRGDQFVVVSYLASMAKTFSNLTRRKGVDKAARFMESLGTPTFALSNLGLLAVPKEYGPLALRSVGFCAGAGFTNHLSCFVSTMNGVLRWSFVWMSPIIGDERARRIIASAYARLEAAVAG